MSDQYPTPRNAVAPTYPYLASIPLRSNLTRVSYHSTAENTNARMEDRLARMANARNQSGFCSAYEEGKTVSRAMASVAQREKRAAERRRRELVDPVTLVQR